MKTKAFGLAVFLAFALSLHAQHDESHQAEGESPVMEIITSGIYVYSLEENEGYVGTELHLTYWLNHTWGAGLSYTAKFEEEETLNDIAVIGSWNPASWITLNAGPNFGLPGDHRGFELGAYAEAEINVRPTKWLHFGPIAGTVLGKSSELTAGFHLGFEF